MNKGNKSLLFAAVCAGLCFSRAGAQNVVKDPVNNEPVLSQMQNNELAVERRAGDNQTADETGPAAWQTTVFGQDWQIERETIGKALPEFAAENGIKATDADRAQLAALPIETAEGITRAIANYYLLLDKFSAGYAGRKFEITAARKIDGYILIWLDEPEIRDGGRAIIYSTAKDKIVADFWDGGFRG
ncbi:MAG: hypothetical protein PHD82_06395 [Candidatus Riflebacteria bacterium]|nr:hypothetical protein [Candidatus Riflebacteria bacterium]